MRSTTLGDCTSPRDSECNMDYYRAALLPDNLGEIKRLAFSAAEYQRRVRLTQEVIREKKLDALLCTHINTICYLTGFETTNHFVQALLIVPAEGDLVLLTDDFEVYNNLTSSWIKDIVVYPAFGDPVPAIVELLRDKGWTHKRLAWEEDWWGMTYRTYLMVRDGVEAKWSYERGIVEWIMALDETR